MRCEDVRRVVEQQNEMMMNGRKRDTLRTTVSIGSSSAVKYVQVKYVQVKYVHVDDSRYICLGTPPVPRTPSFRLSVVREILSKLVCGKIS